MRIDVAGQKMASNQREREAKGRDPLVDADVPTPIRIPFRLDDAIMVCSLANTKHMARTRVIGAMLGKYILITEPTVKINDRISAILDENFLCSYFNNGFMHIFQSKYRRHLTEDVVCIDYPVKVDVRQIRKIAGSGLTSKRNALFAVLLMSSTQRWRTLVRVGAA